ncbi:helix-turn-helix domain-containing protein (plasmid) [Sutcliffiella horikoshii]|nr:helix-turn-helix domain-containing protein [Sutcliffiella horikoshii]
MIHQDFVSTVEPASTVEGNTLHDEYPLVFGAEVISEVLNISLRKAYDIMEQKDFPLVRIGRHKKVTREAFFQWLQKVKKTV